MKAPLEWIKDYVDIPVSTRELCEKMVMHGLGVEGVSRTFEAYDGVVVGKLVSVEKHENADKLLVCLADIGEDKQIQVVTGAPNVYEGMLCPIAVDGANLPDGQCIHAGEIRGIR